MITLIDYVHKVEKKNWTILDHNSQTGFEWGLAINSLRPAAELCHNSNT